MSRRWKSAGLPESESREQQDWKEKELQKDEEDPKREKEPGGEVEKQEGEPTPPPCS